MLGLRLAFNLQVWMIQACPFLRVVLGTLFEIGKGKMKAEEINRIIKAKDRSMAGFSVPAHGLFLERVIYP